MSLRNHWLNLPRRSGTSSEVRSWLREKGSLTRRAQQHFEHFDVTPLFQGWARSLLQAGKGQPGSQQQSLSRVREVLLVGNGAPFLFAHSVLTGDERGRLSCWLQGLGGRSLGTLLFKHPGFKRGKLSYARLGPNNPLHQVCLQYLPENYPVRQKCLPLWARCCEHRLGRQSVWVTELFLADALE